ncbi:f-box protein [Colletotrichum asianum]
MTTHIEDELCWDWSDDGSITKIISQMRFVVRNAARINNIRSVTLQGMRTTQRLGREFCSKNFDEEERAVLGSWLAKVRGEAPGELQLPDVIAAIVSHLSSATTLEIQTFDRATYDDGGKARSPEDPFLCTLGQLISSSNDSSLLNSLERVKLCVPVPDGDLEKEFGCCIYPESILPFFSLPSIKTLELHRVNEGGKPIKPISLLTAPTLKSLVLQRCQLAEDNIATIIRSSPTLEVLRLDIAIDANCAKGWLNMENLQTALAPLKESLKELSLSLTLWSSTAIDCGGPGPWGIRGSIGSLEDFTSLTHLAISLPVLLSWKTQGASDLIDVLPESLEVLTITNEMASWWKYQWDDLNREDDDAEVARWETMEWKIMEFLECRPPSLKELRIEIGEVAGPEEQRVKELKARLVDTGRPVGVNVIVEFKT